MAHSNNRDDARDTVELVQNSVIPHADFEQARMGTGQCFGLDFVKMLCYPIQSLRYSTTNGRVKPRKVALGLLPQREVIQHSAPNHA